MPHHRATVPGRPSSRCRHQELRLVVLIIFPERIELERPKSTTRSPIPNSSRRSISSILATSVLPAISGHMYTFRVVVAGATPVTTQAKSSPSYLPGVYRVERASSPSPSRLLRQIVARREFRHGRHI
nr:uncharacterized protein LOC127305105 [Lolium perenne]